MTEDKKASFPMIPNAHWWALRKKFKQSIPGVVTDNYIATVLDMKLSSARANVLPALKATKIIDTDGRPLDRAKRWRDDEQYSAVCEEIRRDVYPQELLDGVANPSSERAAAERWFANHTGAGEAAVRKLVAFYSLLSEADPAKGAADAIENAGKRPNAAQPERRSRGRRASPSAVEPLAQNTAPTASSIDRRTHPASNGGSPDSPSVYINLQIHISADASTEQIDQIFASMAKHIYKRSHDE